MATTADRPGRWLTVKPGRVSNQIVDQVTSELLAGRLRPGDYLGTETDLASQFGVSRTTVRSAVRTLETLGAVTVQVGASGGVRVSQGDVMRFVEVLAIQLQLAGIDRDEMKDTQLAIESHAAGRAALERSDDDLETLRTNIEETRGCADDYDRFTALAVAFHTAVMSAQLNSTLAAMHRSLTAAMAVRFRAGSNPATFERVVREHEAVFRAIEAGDPAAAQRLMGDHICHRDSSSTDRAAAADD